MIQEHKLKALREDRTHNMAKSVSYSSLIDITSDNNRMQTDITFSFFFLNKDMWLTYCVC